VWRVRYGDGAAISSGTGPPAVPAGTAVSAAAGIAAFASVSYQTAAGNSITALLPAAAIAAIAAGGSVLAVTSVAASGGVVARIFFGGIYGQNNTSAIFPVAGIIRCILSGAACLPIFAVFTVLPVYGACDTGTGSVRAACCSVPSVTASRSHGKRRE
jgi:hypothetical protein